jgi:hypothetical protein
MQRSTNISEEEEWKLGQRRRIRGGSPRASVDRRERSSDPNQTPAFTIWMIGAGLERLGAGYDVTLNLALAI